MQVMMTDKGTSGVALSSAEREEICFRILLREKHHISFAEKTVIMTF